MKRESVPTSHGTLVTAAQRRARAVSAALRSQPLARARQARSVEELPNAIPDASALFDMEVLERVLASSEVDTWLADQRLATPASDQSDASAEPPRTREAVCDALSAGKSLVVRGAERCDPGLRTLADEVARALGGAAQVRLVVTPAGQRLGWHDGMADLLILETSGAADYFFRQRAESEEGDVFDLFRRDDDRAQLPNCTLIEGDLLYLPSGWAHEARSRREAWSIVIELTSPHS